MTVLLDILTSVSCYRMSFGCCHSHSQGFIHTSQNWLTQKFLNNHDMHILCPPKWVCYCLKKRNTKEEQHFIKDHHPSSYARYSSVSFRLMILMFKLMFLYQLYIWSEGFCTPLFTWSSPVFVFLPHFVSSVSSRPAFTKQPWHVFTRKPCWFSAVFGCYVTHHLSYDKLRTVVLEQHGIDTFVSYFKLLSTSVDLSALAVWNA